jgi:hypothetical protein
LNLEITEVQEIGRTKVSAGGLAAFAMALVCALVSVACVAIPMYVIRPFHPQAAAELAYPIEKVLAEKLIQDRLAGVPVLIVVGRMGLRFGFLRLRSLRSREVRANG